MAIAKTGGRRREGVRWRRLTLLQRFALTTLLVMLFNLGVLGWWVGEAIKAGVVNRAAAATSLYVENSIAGELQDLGTQARLSPAHVAALERLLGPERLGEDIVTVRVWNSEGRIVFGHDAGQVFPVEDEQARAWNGEVVSHISNLGDAHNAAQRAQYGRLLETYAPVHLAGGGGVIAVIEFYSTVDSLVREVRAAQVRSWLIVSGVTAATFLLLVGLMRQGSITITRQQRELEGRVAELNGLLDQNRTLHQRVRNAAQRTATLNEQFLRRISAELHDGPAQEVSFALLRLDSVEAAPEHAPARDLGAVQSSLTRAAGELRSIAAGLRLPELEPLTLSETALRAVRELKRRAGRDVVLELGKFGKLPDDASLSLKITVYRVIQEALTNAAKHAGACAMRVTLSCVTDELVLSVTDDGAGFHSDQEERSGRLGLVGMRERVESLGGTFALSSAPGRGTRVSVRLPFSGESRYE